MKNITCESETPTSYIITIKPLLNLTFYNEFLFLAQTCKENNIIGSRSERIIIIYRYSYIFTYLCFFTLFMIITAIYIKRFVRNIINPIKQVTYKIHRVLKMMFKKKNSILIDDNIVIREKTEIRDIAECFSICFRKLMKKNIFMNELKLGENLISGKQKSIHNKIPEKMMDTVKESIEKIPNSFQEKCD